jgi:hypothetical protein
MSNLVRFLEAGIPHGVKDCVMEAGVLCLPVTPTLGTPRDANDYVMETGMLSFIEIR